MSNDKKLVLALRVIKYSGINTKHWACVNRDFDEGVCHDCNNCTIREALESLGLRSERGYSGSWRSTEDQIFPDYGV